MLSEASYHNMTVGRIPSVEGGIQPTIVDAKGDLIAAVAADSLNRLAVGSNDQVLVADSAASTGLAWKSYGAQVVAGKNAVINGGMDIWQRGTSISTLANNTYCADRWTGGGGGAAMTVSRQDTGDTTNLPNIQYAARVQRDNTNANTNNRQFIQTIETANSIPFAGKTVTLSFYARAGANFSAASNLLKINIGTGTGTDQSAWPGFTGASTPLDTSVTLTTTWQRFSATTSLASNIKEIYLNFFFTPVGTAGANDYFEITGVQLEQGSVATPFSRAGGTIQGELAACQRYFQVITAGPTTGINSTTQVAFNPAFAPMRSSSITFALTGALGITDVYTADFNQSSSNITTNSNNGVSGAILSFGNFTGLTAYRGYSLKSTNQITASAEL
jgi:hypothetical protein